MNRIVVTFVLLLLGLSPLGAQEPIRFARTPAISPDGKLVAFSYLGDIWTVSVKGGVAHHLTMHEKHDYTPIFSPDGKWLAFSSNRHGTYDVFIIPVEGGRPRRLTHDSADDIVCAWSPDSQSVLFNSNRLPDVPVRFELYSVSINGGRARQVSGFEGRDGVYSPKGDKIAYVRGPGLWYRKGYRGSSNDDIWISDADGLNNRRLTTHDGQDSYPMWSADGKQMYYVSDVASVQSNIVRIEMENAAAKAEPVRITHHKDDNVRRARISANGEVIVYEAGADIFVHSVKQNKSEKLRIIVNADDKAGSETVMTFTTGATEYVWSPDEKQIAFVVHGEIFLMPRAGGKAKRLTDSPAFDHGITWSPDGKKLLFLSDRAGQEDIYTLEPDDPEHPDLVNAHRYKVKRITNSPEAELGVSFSPDGKRVAFLRASKLMTMNPDGTDQKLLVSDRQVFDYDWSPDGKYLCYAGMDGSFASELFIIPATGATATQPARNITRFATYNSGMTWSRTGNKLAFISQRKSNTFSAYVLSLQKPAINNVTTGKDIDWDNIHLRVKQPASMAINECAIANDGTKIAFRGTSDGIDDLWLANVDGGSIQRLTTGGLKPTQIQWSRYFPGQIYFRDGSGALRAVMIGGPTVVGPTTVAFTARMTVRQDELFREMFDQSWRALNENFYDKSFHGVNWDKIREKYRPIVDHCAVKEDLYALVSLMLGELNASHLGITGGANVADRETADLGLLFDRSHNGPELKIAEVIKDGPGDRHGINLKPGDLITRIDGVDLGPNVELSKLLNDKVGEVLTLHLTDPRAADSKRRVEIRAEKRSKISDLLYERWITRNAQHVSERSNGKLGYIHIPTMTEPGLERFVRALYSDNFDKEGIVLDVRFNGGGFTHDQVLNYLVGKEHTTFTHRDGGSGWVLRSNDRKWTKPLTLLMNNRSFSDAEIFPHAFRTWGLGKLVGQPTGGFVIGTRSISLIDGSQFRTPRIGVHTVKGVNMEKEGVQPDILIEPLPDDLARGIDRQLDRAVEVLMQDVTAWKKTRPMATPAAGGQ